MSWYYPYLREPGYLPNPGCEHFFRGRCTCNYDIWKFLEDDYAVLLVLIGMAASRKDNESKLIRCAALAKALQDHKKKYDGIQDYNVFCIWTRINNEYKANYDTRVVKKADHSHYCPEEEFVRYADEAEKYEAIVKGKKGSAERSSRERSRSRSRDKSGKAPDKYSKTSRSGSRKSHEEPSKSERRSDSGASRGESYKQSYRDDYERYHGENSRCGYTSGFEQHRGQ